jgi:hypothetical protein
MVMVGEETEDGFVPSCKETALEPTAARPIPVDRPAGPNVAEDADEIALSLDFTAVAEP